MFMCWRDKIVRKALALPEAIPGLNPATIIVPQVPPRVISEHSARDKSLTIPDVISNKNNTDVQIIINE